MSDDSTRASLLLRIRDPRDAEAWTQFEQLYAPLLYRYARAAGLGDADALDIRSVCYLQIVEQIGRFEYEKAKGGFKGWLRTLVRRRVVDLLRKRREQRADTAVYAGAASDDDAPDVAFEQAWKLEHLRWCIEQVRAEVPPAQLAAFEMLALEQVDVPTVMTALDLNRNQVYKAKSRVLELVRQRMLALYPDDDQASDAGPLA